MTVPEVEDQLLVNPEKLLLFNFTHVGEAQSCHTMIRILSTTVINTPGLIWKTWLLNEQCTEAGGIYLFCDTESLQVYTALIQTELKKHEDISNLCLKTFSTLNEIPLVALKHWLRPI